MGVFSKRSWSLVLTAGLAVCMLAALAALPGCGSDQAKQDFVDYVLAIIQENQSQTEIAEEGRAAFQAYYQSGFTDLDSAAAAADSFVKSNEKDAQSLQELEALEKPDEAAQELVDVLVQGIETMDEGNALYAQELAKAPDQSVEERSQVFVVVAEAMGIYLEGISAIIDSCAMLLDYANANGLEGQQEIENWYDKFKSEKESLEQAMEAMSAGQG